MSSQHWPDPGRPDTSDDQDHHVPARVGYLATHKQQDPGSSGKTRSWSVSTSRSSATDSSESRPERAESEKWWHLGSRIKGRSASQTSSDSQRSDHEGIAEEEGAEGDAKTAATSQVLPVFACLMSVPVTVRFWLTGRVAVDKIIVDYVHDTRLLVHIQDHTTHVLRLKERLSETHVKAHIQQCRNLHGAVIRLHTHTHTRTHTRARTHTHTHIRKHARTHACILRPQYHAPHLKIKRNSAVNMKYVIK